ncbi:MAG: HMA2 domain-containing protein [Campylobacterota bacterium]
MIDEKTLIEVTRYFTIIHHIKGRIRVRVNPKIKDMGKSITIEDIEALPRKINGIKNIKINKVVGSITIEYDHMIFPYNLWEDMILQKNTEHLVGLLNNLAREIA